MSQYPEHKKLELFTEAQRNAIFEYIEFMENQGYGLFDVKAPYNVKSFEDAFYEMINVDKKQLEKERQHMLNKK